MRYSSMFTTSAIVVFQRRAVVLSIALLQFTFLALYGMNGKISVNSFRYESSAIPETTSESGLVAPNKVQDFYRALDSRTFDEITPISEDDNEFGDENILQANYILTHLSVPENITTEGDYSGVKAWFCPVDWQAQKKLPNSFPRFSNVYHDSCPEDENYVEYPLDEIVRHARRYDARNSTKVTQLRQSGFIFHESRCGSTLAANMLTVADPAAHRVYSEPDALHKALKSNNANLVKDVLYMMGRSNNPNEKSVFYKLRSVAVLSIRNMPDLPWIFLYRNPREVVASHFNPTENDMISCLRERKRPHPIMHQLAKEYGSDINHLTDEEFCAVLLASLCRAAIQHHNATKQGHFLNYKSLPESMWETILPNHFGVKLSSASIRRMKEISQVYSKAGKKKNVADWEKDSKKKRKELTKEQRGAATKIMQVDFDQMQAISKANDSRN